MMKRYEFIERVIYLLREKMEHQLPDEATMDELIEKTKDIFKNIL